MIKISVDEGYAFDILSIFEVKVNNCTDTAKVQSSKDGFYKLHEELLNQLGYVKMYEIINSQEYRDLYNENLTTFTLVDKIRASDEVSIGKDIDLNNLRRFECKRKLQSRFFNTNMVETKTKYE